MSGDVPGVPVAVGLLPAAAVHRGDFKLVNDLLAGSSLTTSVLIPGQRPGRWRHG